MEINIEKIEKKNIKKIEKAPKYVFIVPYRDRYSQLICYINQMSYILEDLEHYEIIISHQKDNRIFNRGAMKNLGFIYIKNKYPESYKSINFIFQDVDTLPSYKNMFNYETEEGKIKHYYGFKQTLGGLLSVKGSDYEYLNGFPNLWGWGYEDNCLYKRCYYKKVEVDRSVFYDAYDKEIIQLGYGNENKLDREVNITGKQKLISDNGYDGISTIKNESYSINNSLKLPKNNKVLVIDFKNWIVPETEKNVKVVKYNKEYLQEKQKPTLTSIRKNEIKQREEQKKKLKKPVNKVLLGGNVRPKNKFNMGFTY